MIACEPPRLLEFLWGTDQIRFELEPTAQGTRLTLYGHRRSRTARRPATRAGWHVCLDGLRRLLDGTRQDHAGAARLARRASGSISSASARRPRRSGRRRATLEPASRPQRATRSSSFDSLRATAASMNARKSGCAFVGREVNSGWAWVPT